MAEPATPADALALAVAKIGSQSKMALRLGVSQTAVWKWLKRRKPLPAEHVLAVEGATGVSRHVLRPDLYPVEADSVRTVPIAGRIGSCERKGGMQIGEPAR